MSALLVSLKHRFISINGPDALKFLQGQSSCDLLTLNDDRFSFGTLNTPKGRMYALFKVIKTDQGLLLSLDESLLQSTLEKLRKYAVFFKCELQEANGYQAYGLMNAPANERALHLQKANQSYLLTLSAKHALQEIWLPTSVPVTEMASLFGLPEAIPLDQAETSLAAWNTLETRCGIPALYASTQDEFILQTLNLQQLGAVSFKKGCYTGQEIIARMKFLGKLKKKTFLLHSDQQCVAEPNQAVLDAQGNKCGTVVRSHCSETYGSCTLAILNIEDAETLSTVALENDPQASFVVSELDYSEYAG